MDVLRDEEIAAIAKLWHQSGRELITSFEGLSMMPTIAPGQRVRIRCTTDLEPGDVAAFVQGQSVIVHRLVTRSSGATTWWLFRGDANVICDVPVLAADQIVGRVEAVELDGEFLPPAPQPASVSARVLTAIALACVRLDIRLGATVLRIAIALRRAVFGATARTGVAR